jgi:RNA polymerase sigma factor (TIGR02999 family)
VDAPTGEVTELLKAWSAGDRNVEARLFELVLPDLRKLAQCFLRRESPNHSLQPTALLNEAYLRLVGARARDWQDRRHFFAITARVMRRLLIDHARGRRRAEFVDMEGIEAMLKGRDAQLEQAVQVDSVLDELEALSPEMCHIVELRFFLGLTEEEAAEALGIPVRTAQRRYSDARKWLFERLNGKE